MPRLLRQGAWAFLLAMGLLCGSPALAYGQPTGNRPWATDTEISAHPGGQHGGADGHLPAEQRNVDLVSKLELTDLPDRIGDVAVFEDTAYLAAFAEPDCANGGVYVVDISDVGKPKEIAFIPTATGSFVGEGVQVLEMKTRAFRGDVLLFNNEICADSVDPADPPVGGATLVDVSDPSNPRVLAAGFGDLDPSSATGEASIAHEVHSAFAWQHKRQAYAVLVDDEEPGTADVDIFDISDPTKPVKIAEHGLGELFPQIVQEQLPNLTEVFLHDMIVKKIAGRQVMLASYWDAGYVTVDVTDPVHPKYLGDTDFANPDPELLESTAAAEVPEGNAHQAEFTEDDEFVIGADEDFAPYPLKNRNLTDGTDIHAAQGSETPPLAPGQTVQGGTVFAGLACPGGEAVPTGDGSQVAVVERGVCPFTEKVASVEAAGGYVAILIFDREGADGCAGAGGFTAAGGIFTVGIAPRAEGFAIFDAPFNAETCLAGDGLAPAPIEIGTTGDTVSFAAYFDGWGYVHLFDNSTGKMSELDTYAIAEAHDPAFASGFGDLSVHEVATSDADDDLAYLSYYAGGLRVVKIVDDQLVEVGSFIDDGGNNFWGVQVFEGRGQEYVAASDRDFGLYIFRYADQDEDKN